MDTTTLAMLVFISVLMGAALLFGVLWGIKNRQFEDYRKFLDGANLDDEDALNEAYQLELRKKEALKKRLETSKKEHESKGEHDEADKKL
ncbi:cbb3-type cytochrome oxidase assembly protein CcoS [Campylobacter concisus]